MVTDPGLSEDRFQFLSDVEEEHFWFTARRDLVVGLLRQHVPANAGQLLDLGCGPGANLPAWAPFAKTVTGMDVHLADADAKHQIVTGSVAELPFADESADAVLILDVLEHVDDVVALREACRVLGSGGRLFVSVPAHPWLWGARDRDADHQRRYTRRDLHAKLLSAGFEVITFRPYQCLLFPLVIASRMLGKLSSASRDVEDRPPRLLNRLFGWINRFEVWVSLRMCPMPTGSSYLCVAQKTRRAQ